jgi:hypothetical protein
MVSLPDNIKRLMQSAAYNNSNHPDHAATAKQVSDWFNKKYSNSYTDDTGKNVSVRTAWIWHAIDDERTCDDCASFSDVVYEHKADIPDHPHHPNCRCWIEEIEVDDNDNIVHNEAMDNAANKTFEHEGGYVDDPRLIDQPTNMGITQPTLDAYNKGHPNFNFPDYVKDLTPEQARQIFDDIYYVGRGMDEINNDRIRNAIADMGFMTTFPNVDKVVQQTLNEIQNAGLKVDGIMGSKTKEALNNIPANDVDSFMGRLKENRLNYLRSLRTWSQFGRGWTNRTNTY